VDGEDLLRMKPREIKRLHLIRQALEQKISQKQAAEVAGLSPRQMRRLMKRVVAEGDRGILHRRRGKPSNRRIADKTKQKVLELFEKHYPDYGPTLASEKLHERHRIQIHPETLRLWLRQARLPYKQRKARPHRQWRPRRSCFGEMVQLDGSHHDWLEGRGPKLVLTGISTMRPARSRRVSMIMRVRYRLWTVFGTGFSAMGFRAVCIWTNIPRIGRPKCPRWRNNWRDVNSPKASSSGP
jgi:transposase